jgi:transposase-like protein
MVHDSVYARYERIVMDNFGYTCPFCYEQDKLSYLMGTPSYLSCKACGARWNLHWLLSKLTGAVLVQDGMKGTGAHLLHKKYPMDFWRRMGLEGRKNLPSPPTEMKPAKEKEIITQTKVIVKVKCPYCRNLYDETLDKCPNCGGKR